MRGQETAEPVALFACRVRGCGNRVAKRGTVCTESTGGTARPARGATPEQHAAYRAGLCVGLCGHPPAPGRPRCDGCHQTMLDERGGI